MSLVCLSLCKTWQRRTVTHSTHSHSTHSHSTVISHTCVCYHGAGWGSITQHATLKHVVDLRTGPWLLGIPAEKAEGHVFNQSSIHVPSRPKWSEWLCNKEILFPPVIKIPDISGLIISSRHSDHQRTPSSDDNNGSSAMTCQKTKWHFITRNLKFVCLNA